jgi:hypothetical protein
MERHKEVSRILETMDPSQAKLFNYVFVELMNSDDQLLTAIESGRKLRELFSSANLVERSALMHALDFALETKLLGQQFKFENGLPVSLEPKTDDSAEVWATTPDITIYLQIDGVSTAPHYKNRSDEVEFTDEKGFFLRTTAWDEAGQTTTLLVPVEHLHAYPYIQLVAE